MKSLCNKPATFTRWHYLRKKEREYQEGGDLLFHTVAHAVPSAQVSLTSVFGMGTGVTLPLITTFFRLSQLSWTYLKIVKVDDRGKF